MADYISRTYFGDVIRRRDGVIVAPTNDDQSEDYLEWILWCAEGNQPDVDDTIPLEKDVPSVVARRQMFHALDQAGLLDDVEAFVSSQSRAVQIDWNESREFQRDNLMINTMAPLLGLSSDDLDDLFITANSIS